jgi:DNA-directed RNA polymerase subunit K/omega
MTAKKLSRTLELDNEKIVGKIGDRFMTVIIASQRARELARQHRHKDDGVHFNAPITALLEIQNGEIDLEYVRKIR